MGQQLPVGFKIGQDLELFGGPADGLHIMMEAYFHKVKVPLIMRVDKGLDVDGKRICYWAYRKDNQTGFGVEELDTVYEWSEKNRRYQWPGLTV